ncbi:MAG: hypothetical protein AAF682_18480 [Planctomycetota bacterium]
MSRAGIVRIGVRVAALLAISVVGAEVALRMLGVAAPTPGGYPRGLYASDPTLSFRLASDFEGDMITADRTVSIRTNAEGFRDAPFGAKRPGVLRIAALGDSFSFGHNVADDDAYPTLLEGLLSTPEREVEVLNLGVPGYSTLQHLAQLELLGPELAPDLVLCGTYLGNDLSDNLLRRSPRPRARQGFLIQAEADEPDWRVSLRANLNRYSRLWRLFGDWRRRRELRAIELSDGGLRGAYCELAQWSASVALELHLAEPTADATEAMEISRNTFASLHAFCRDTLGAPLAVALLPHPLQYDPAGLVAIQRDCGLDPAAYDLDKPNTELTAHAQETGYPLLDLTPHFRERVATAPGERLYFDIHFNEQGHLLAAEAIAAFLGERGLVR